jgi:hypothetical protein
VRRRRWRQIVLIWIAFLTVAAAVVCASHPHSDHHHTVSLPLCTDAGSAAIQLSDATMFFADRAGSSAHARCRSAGMPHAAISTLLYESLEDRAPQPAQTPRTDSVSLPRLFFSVLHL